MQIIDIHPLDVAEMFQSATEEIVISSRPDPLIPGSNLTIINGTVYRQTPTAPRKGNTIV